MSVLCVYEADFSIMQVSVFELFLQFVQRMLQSIPQIRVVPIMGWSTMMSAHCS